MTSCFAGGRWKQGSFPTISKHLFDQHPWTWIGSKVPFEFPKNTYSLASCFFNAPQIRRFLAENMPRQIQRTVQRQDKVSWPFVHCFKTVKFLRVLLENKTFSMPHLFYQSFPVEFFVPASIQLGFSKVPIEFPKNTYYLANCFFNAPQRGC